MKRFLFILLFIFLSSYSFSVDSKALIGFWKLVKSKDMQTKEIYKPDKSVYYHFHNDKTLIMTDTSTRERSEWDWRLNGNNLLLISQFGDARISGDIAFLPGGNLRYSLDSVDNGNYVWIFEKFD